MKKALLQAIGFSLGVFLATPIVNYFICELTWKQGLANGINTFFTIMIFMFIYTYYNPKSH